MRCVASIINHSTALKMVIQLYPGHPLSQVPFLSDDALLSNFKLLVTTYLSEKMGAPTGIPIHVSVLGKVSEILTLLKEEWSERQQTPTILCKSVEDAIENQAAGNGHLNSNLIKQKLSAHQQNMHHQSTAQNYAIANNLSEILATIKDPNQQHHHTGKFSTVGHIFSNMSPTDSPSGIRRHPHQWDG